MIHYHPHLMLVIGAQIVITKPLVQSTDKVLVRTIENIIKTMDLSVTPASLVSSVYENLTENIKKLRERKECSSDTC